MRPFKKQEYSEPTGLDKILKKTPEKNFLVDVNNLLVEKNLDELSPVRILALADRYKIKNPNQKYKLELMQFLFDFLSEHLGSPISDTSDYASAKLMQKNLGISDVDFDKEYIIRAIDVYKRRVNAVLEKNRIITDEIESQLEQLGISLNLPSDQATKSINEARMSIVQSFSNKIISDRRVSPDEKKDFEELCKNLRVTASYDPVGTKNLQKFELLWKVENAELPVYATEIFLQKNESCHFKADVKLHEIRKVSTGVQYHGSTYRMKIAKGWYLRSGNIKGSRQYQDVMTLIDTGVLYITSKRILFVGEKGNKTITYSQILDLTPYSDGIQIVKSTGKSPFFELIHEDGEVLAATIGRIITDKT